MMCPTMGSGCSMSYFMLVKAAIIIWAIVVPIMILWRLDKIIKLLEKK
ncbi:MAG: hypothetical protein P9M07_05300 [Candidatus Aceula meridiana]|nr:hypothetical protein [Candidatus Aceula meridiana]